MIRSLFTIIAIIAFALVALLVIGAFQANNGLAIVIVLLGIVGLAARRLGRRRDDRVRD